MALLLDTNALLWYLQDSPSLSLVAKNAIDAAGLDVVVSTASIWEISIKIQTGKLVLGQDLDVLCSRIAVVGWSMLPIYTPESKLAGALPMYHRDPLDRMLVAQCQLYGHKIASADEKLDFYGVSRIW